MVPSSSTLSVDQSITHVNELPSHKSDQQFTTNFSFSTLSFTQTHTHRCMQEVQLQHTLFIRHPRNSLLPERVHHTVSVSHTPGELNAVNVCTNRLLIDKLFMLSRGRRRDGRRGTTTQQNRLHIQMHQLMFVYSLLPQREELFLFLPFFFFFFELSPGKAVAALYRFEFICVSGWSVTTPLRCHMLW